MLPTTPFPLAVLPLWVTSGQSLLSLTTRIWGTAAYGTTRGMDTKVPVKWLAPQLHERSDLGPTQQVLIQQTHLALPSVQEAGRVFSWIICESHAPRTLISVCKAAYASAWQRRTWQPRTPQLHLEFSHLPANPLLCPMSCLLIFECKYEKLRNREPKGFFSPVFLF